jgi:hypothetical protein
MNWSLKTSKCQMSFKREIKKWPWEGEPVAWQSQKACEGKGITMAK